MTGLKALRNGHGYLMKTVSMRAQDVQHSWFLVDAQDKTLGRLATEIAHRLRGKHKPQYTPHVDTGDFIVVVNAEKVRVTGAKTTDKIYYRHTGHPGGIKGTSFERMRDTHPERILEAAVRGMLPRNPLGRAMFKKLKIYAGDQHPHTAQQPVPLEI
jgi:large subunit ribosomal protein L13